MANQWIIRSRVRAYVSASIDDFPRSKGLSEVRRSLNVPKVIPCKRVVVKLEIRYLCDPFAYDSRHAAVVVEVIVNRNISRGRRRVGTIGKLIPRKEISLEVNGGIGGHSVFVPRCWPQTIRSGEGGRELGNPDGVVR